MSKEFNRGILVKKDGIYRRDWNDGEQLEEKIESFIPYLNEEIRVKNDITFEDFFNHVMKEYEIMSVIFASHLGNFNLGKWKNEWEKPFVNEFDGHTKPKYLEVSWVAELWDEDIYGNHKQVEEWISFGGRGESLNEETGDWENDVGISFSFSPINELKDFPFYINTEYKMFDWKKDKINRKNNKKSENCYCVVGVKPMKLFDVIGGILGDISFYGEPENRNETGEELRQQSDDLEKLLDEKGHEQMLKDGDIHIWKFDDDNE